MTLVGLGGKTIAFAAGRADMMPTHASSSANTGEIVTSRIVVSIALAICVGLGATACGGGSTGSGDPNLSVAIGFLPSGSSASYLFEFADFGSIEHSLGDSTSSAAAKFPDQFEHLSGGSPGGDVSFDLTSVPGAFWTSADVLWDSEQLPLNLPPVAITAFRNGSVIPAVEKRLTKCGFHSRSVGGFSVYTTTNFLACLSSVGAGRPSAYSVFAFDPSDRLVLQSGSQASVTAAIANHQRTSSDPILSTILSRLGDVPQVAVLLGPQWCRRFSNPSFLAGRGATSGAVTRAEHLFSDSTPYLGFGLGYRYGKGSISGKLAFDYSSATAAKSDLGPRERMLRDGVAFNLDEPYSKLFTVRSGQAQGATAVYQIGRSGNAPLGVGAMIEDDDLGFARC